MYKIILYIDNRISGKSLIQIIFGGINLGFFKLFGKGIDYLKEKLFGAYFENVDCNFMYIQ